MQKLLALPGAEQQRNSPYQPNSMSGSKAQRTQRMRKQN